MGLRGLWLCATVVMALGMTGQAATIRVPSEQPTIQAAAPSRQGSPQTHVSDTVEPILWDTVATHEVFDGGGIPERKCSGLIVSNHGEVGHAGLGGVNLDFVVSGYECGIRHADSVYLHSGSPFLIEDRDGEFVLTVSINQLDQEKVYSWTPIVTSQGMTGGLATDGSYDSVYSGVFVNRDSTIAMERRYYAIRDDRWDHRFIVVGTSVFTLDGESHNDLTIGTVVDWNIPSDSVGVNSSHESWAGDYTDYIYMRGIDTVGGDECRPAIGHVGVESVLGWYRTSELAVDPCVNHGDFWGIWGGSVDLLRDTNLTRSGEPISPPQIDVSAWIEDIGNNPGYVPHSGHMNQAIWLTFFLNENLAADDTLLLWTVLSTDISGGRQYISPMLFGARQWYKEHLRACTPSCCIGRVGDANGLGGDEPTIGDVSVMINAKFIAGTCEGLIACLAKADVNQSGGCGVTCDDITIGDIATLIDYLFITARGPLYHCLECP